MTVNSASFRSISGLTNWLVWFTIASIILAIISIAAMTYEVLISEYDSLLEDISDYS
jgi:hypothetical protein